MITNDVNLISSANNLERKIWIDIYIENKIGKAQATLFNFTFIILGATTFTTFAQVSSTFYDALFGDT